jgi:hypothetical protein
VVRDVEAIMAGKLEPHYSGALNEPIRVPQPPRLGLWPEYAKTAVDEIRRQVKAERSAKFALLLQHYGIKAKDPESQQKLIWALISDHVPGMRLIFNQEERGPGRPREKWGLPGLPFDRELVRQIDSQRKSGVFLKEAIERAKTKSAAKQQGTDTVETAIRKTIASGKPDSLENKYREAKWRIELDELVAENTLVNTSTARSKAIEALLCKKHKKKGKEKH